MTKKELKDYVLAEAKKLLAQDEVSNSDAAVVNESKEVVNESEIEDYIDSESILKLAEEMKSINKSLAVNNPLISESNIVDDIVGKEETRKLKTPVGREYNIELKGSLNETMTHYNDQKKVINRDTTSKKQWSHLVNYKRFNEE